MGLVLVKELALIDLEAHLRIADVRMRALPMLRADTAMCAHLPSAPSLQCRSACMRMHTPQKGSCLRFLCATLSCQCRQPRTGSGPAMWEVHQQGTAARGMLVAGGVPIRTCSIGRMQSAWMTSHGMGAGGPVRCRDCRYDLLMVFQTGRSHMVLLTAPPAPPSRPGTPLEDSAGGAATTAEGTPPQTSAHLAEAIQDLKAARTPPHRCRCPSSHAPPPPSLGLSCATWSPG